MKCLMCGKEAVRAKANYKYVESGLDNVVLSGVNVYKCSCGEVMPEIKNAEKLHELIALAIIKKFSLLSGKEFRFLRKQMMLKGKNIASILGVDPVTVSRWEQSNAKIGVPNDRLIRMLYLQTIEEKHKKTLCGLVEGFPLIKRSVKHAKISIAYDKLMRPTMELEKQFACV